MNAKPTPWPAFNVERRAAADLKPYENNARTHSPEQVAQIAASIREWGWTQPILVDEKGGVLAGHGRLMAALELGAAEVPVIVAKGWSKAQKRAYVLADNQLALNAGWDADVLRSELQGLAGFDLGAIGFSEEQLHKIFGASPTGDPDEVVAKPEAITSQAGDVWVMGNHRLLCGDSTNQDDVALVLAGSKPRLMVTDPPYGVSYDPSWREKATGNAARAKGLVLNDDRADWREAWALFPGDVAYVWHGALYAGLVQESLSASGFEVRSQIVWAKDRLVLSRGHYHWRHEPCWYAVRRGSSGGWRGGRKRDTVWRVDGLDEGQRATVIATLGEIGAEESVWEIPITVDDGSTGHGTQKPVECMRRPIENHAAFGDQVYEPFCGSGTTIIAAEMAGAHCRAVELSPEYVDMAVLRWQRFTGRQAVLDGDGRTFADVFAERTSDRAAAA